eukprot:gnl/MRDRNA2_/MRDRNA2_111803_c0_seq1.p1 gnl/MRDRNA2_/MRDRNA2_111803_c0~~gnl/MRDRNA2_/MRDRNA2_111803_c0_seq1.p1  ORF type:complete len:649 (+),score=174.33 gnl/MRDRNA2_/MRDRNA2_111803_c0_seq1:240-2186(+)
MSRLACKVLLVFVAQASSPSHTLDVDTWLANALDNLPERAFKAWPHHLADLDHTTLQKLATSNAKHSADEVRKQSIPRFLKAKKNTKQEAALEEDGEEKEVVLDVKKQKSKKKQKPEPEESKKKKQSTTAMALEDEAPREENGVEKEVLRDEKKRKTKNKQKPEPEESQKKQKSTTAMAVEDDAGVSQLRSLLSGTAQQADAPMVIEKEEEADTKGTKKVKKKLGQQAEELKFKKPKKRKHRKRKGQEEDEADEDALSDRRKIQKLVHKMKEEGKPDYVIKAAKRKLRDNLNVNLRTKDSSRERKAKEFWEEKKKKAKKQLVKTAMNKYKNTQQELEKGLSEDDKSKVQQHVIRREGRQKLFKDQQKFDLVVIPVALRREENQKLREATDAVSKFLIRHGVNAWHDIRRHYTPGQKFAFWEFAGVMLRIEIDADDLANGRCQICLAKEPGNIQTVQRVTVPLPPTGKTELLSALKTKGLAHIKMRGDDEDSEVFGLDSNAEESEENAEVDSAANTKKTSVAKKASVAKKRNFQDGSQRADADESAADASASEQDTDDQRRSIVTEKSRPTEFPPIKMDFSGSGEDDWEGYQKPITIEADQPVATNPARRSKKLAKKYGPSKYTLAENTPRDGTTPPPRPAVGGMPGWR